MSVLIICTLQVQNTKATLQYIWLQDVVTLIFLYPPFYFCLPAQITSSNGSLASIQLELKLDHLHTLLSAETYRAQPLSQRQKEHPYICQFSLQRYNEISHFGMLFLNLCTGFHTLNNAHDWRKVINCLTTCKGFLIQVMSRQHCFPSGIASSLLALLLSAYPGAIYQAVALLLNAKSVLGIRLPTQEYLDASNYFTSPPEWQIIKKITCKWGVSMCNTWIDKRSESQETNETEAHWTPCPKGFFPLTKAFLKQNRSNLYNCTDSSVETTHRSWGVRLCCHQLKQHRHQLETTALEWSLSANQSFSFSYTKSYQTTLHG